MKTTLTLALNLVTFLALAQTDQENQDKYWKYREMLKTKFVKIGSDDGCSIPMACRIPGYAYGGTTDPMGTQLQWKDATITLGYYLIVLATEYKLLESASEQTDATLSELYFALRAINRLDLAAEPYLSGNTSNPSLNGFFLRDDVPYNFWQNWENDGPLYPNLLDDPNIPDDIGDPGSPNRSDSDFNGLNDSNGTQQTDPNQGNAESLDQLTSLLTGLITVYELVDDQQLQPTSSDAPMMVRTEAREIALRIIHYVMQEETNGEFSPIFKILDQDGNLVTRGPDCTGASLALVQMALRLEDPYLESNMAELMLTEVPIMVPAIDLYYAIEGSNAPCMNNFQDDLLALINEDPQTPYTITHVPFSFILHFVNRMQDEHIDLEIHSNTACSEINLTDFLIIQQIELEMPGLCEDIFYDFIGDYLSNLYVALSSSTAGFMSEVMFNINVPQVGDEVCIPSNSLNHDNVHILLELMTCSNIWSEYDYVLDITENDFPYINLLHPVLNNASVPHNSTIQNIYKTLLDGAPCEGPWQDPFDLSRHAPNNWASACNLFKGFQETGPTTEHEGQTIPWLEYSGYYPGLDYMALHNLYYLLWQNQLPEYKRALVCECVLETTELNQLTTTLEVKRQFEEYKAMGIPIESFLAHSLEVSTTTGIMDVKNDLIICRRNPDIPTILTIKDGARLNIYEGNTVTVRAGNKIIVENGSELVGGIPDDACCNGDATLILEENAELQILDATLTNNSGLTIEMKPGSKLIIDGSVFFIADNADGGAIVCDHGEWNMSNSSFIKQPGGTSFHMNFYNETELNFSSSIIDAGNCEFVLYDQSDLWLANCEFALNEGILINDLNGIIDLQSSTLNLSTSNVWCSEGTVLNQFESDIFIHGNSAMEIGHTINQSSNQNHYYYSSGIISLEGNDSHLSFLKGQLHIPANTTFQPIHPNGPSGYIEFRGSGDHELITGTNSVFKIVGDGPTDVMLKMNGYADLWNANFGAGTIILQDCKVDLTDHGRLWTDMKFQATNVTFEDLFDSEDNEGGNVQVWLTNVCGFTNCNFNNARLYTFNSKAAVNNCDFSGNQSGYYASQGGFNVTNSSFVGCHLESHSLSQLSMVNYSLFEDPEHDLQQLNTKFPCIQDESTVELRVLNSTIRDGQMGIVKDGGVLTLKCNLFEDLNSIALTMEMGDLNMSSSSGAGYNNFHLVGTCIELIGAKSLNMASGYNNLSGFSDMCIIGTMNLKCLSAGACELIRYPHYNYWGAAQNTFPPSPNPIGPFDPFMWSKIELRTVSSLSNCNISYPNGPYCDIYLKDDFISVPTGCGTGIPIVRPVRNLGVTSANTSWKGYDSSSANEQFELKDLEVDPGNPLLNTTNFEEIALDSALVYAALQMEIYDSLGNDANAVSLFHEILTSPLDRNNKDIRWRMEWGRYNMKSAMENMFMQDELSSANNVATFETPVAQYVDVLNTMTDTILTDSTYKEQFYVEIDKGQLFRTLGNPLMARHIYMHLDDCQLDSLEQSILNNWREEVDIELSLLDQYINDGVSPDSISFEVDTTSYTPAIPYSTSNYYFGVWIDSPTSATFVNCGDNPEYRILRQSQNNLAVYPNPSTGLITLQIEQEGLYDLAIYDISGKQIHSRQINFSEGGAVLLDLSGVLSTGNYMIVLENEYGMMFSKLVIAD